MVALARISAGEVTVRVNTTSNSRYQFLQVALCSGENHARTYSAKQTDSYFMYFLLLPHSQLILSLEPVFSLMLQAIFLEVMLTSTMIAGSVLVFVALMLSKVSNLPIDDSRDGDRKVTDSLIRVLFMHSVTESNGVGTMKRPIAGAAFDNVL
jgi:hypothetical protein